jgi:hypothetical protein
MGVGTYPTSIGRRHREERRGELDGAVIHDEVGVGRHRVADDGVLPQVGHRVAGVADVVDGQLPGPLRRVENVNPGVAGP